MSPLEHFNTPYEPSQAEIDELMAEQEAIEQEAHDTLVDDIAQRVVEILINNTNIKLEE